MNPVRNQKQNMNNEKSLISNGVKKTLLFMAISFVSFVPLALAQTQSGFVPLAPIPGLTDQSITSAVNSESLANFFNNLYKYLIGLAAAIAVIQIIWAGLDIAFFHKDAVSAITDDKGKIYNAIYGLILVLSPVLVFSIINPNILNLSLNLPKLDTVSGRSPVQTAPVTPYTQQPGTTRPGTLSAARNGTCIAFQDGGYKSPQPCAYCYKLKTSLSANDPLNLNQGSVATYYCANSSINCTRASNDLLSTDNSTCSQQIPGP